MKILRSMAVTGLVCLCMLICLQGRTAAQDNGRKPVDFLPQWSPQAQFAGFYVAAAKGFYEQRGISVNLLRGGPERPSGADLAAGKVDFGTLFLTEAISRYDQGVEIVNVGQIVQRSALMLVTRKTSGISTPEDFSGRRVSLWSDFRLQPTAFFRKHHLDVTIVPQGYTLNLFLMGGVDAATAMWYNEYYTILNSGVDPEEMNTFLLADYGLNFPEDGIYCRKETLQQDPEMVRSFVQGSIAGWEYAFDHPEEALVIVMTHVQAANLPTNEVHQEWMLARMRDIVRPAGSSTPMGTLIETDFHFVAEQLHQNGIIKTIPDYAEFHDPTCSKP